VRHGRRTADLRDGGPARRPASKRALAHPLPAPRPMTEWLRLVRGEYSEMPGLNLTKGQMQRLWNLDGPTCDVILEVLEETRFLRRTERGAYVRNDG
jgi:hypothetical protein